MGKKTSDKPSKKTKKVKKPKEPKFFIIPGAVAAPEKPKPTKTTTKKAYKKASDMTEDEWLEKQSENPYMKLKKKTLEKIDPSKHSIWVKYVKKVNEQRCTGGMLVKNAFPTYVKLRNPYSRAEFSVQIADIIPYTRRSNLRIIKTKT